MSSRNRVLYTYNLHLWILKTVKDAEDRTVRMLPAGEGQTGDFWNRWYTLDT